MAVCLDCKQEMDSPLTESCDPRYISFDNGKTLLCRNTIYFDSDIDGRCHDCGIMNSGGNLHHFGCDTERCPKCNGQIMSCGCSSEFSKLYFGYPVE